MTVQRIRRKESERAGAHRPGFYVRLLVASGFLLVLLMPPPLLPLSLSRSLSRLPPDHDVPNAADLADGLRLRDHARRCRVVKLRRQVGTQRSHGVRGRAEQQEGRQHAEVKAGEVEAEATEEVEEGVRHHEQRLEGGDALRLFSMWQVWRWGSSEGLSVEAASAAAAAPGRSGVRAVPQPNLREPAEQNAAGDEVVVDLKESQLRPCGVGAVEPIGW